MYQLLLVFVKSDITLIIALVVGLILTCSKMKVLENFKLRVFTTSLLLLLWLFFINWLVLLYKEAWYLQLSITKYMVVFIILVVAVKSILDINWYTAFFCSTISYSLQHMSQRIESIIYIEFFPDKYIFELFLLIFFSVIVYYTIYKLLIKKYVKFDNNVSDPNKFLIIAAIIVVYVDIIACTSAEALATNYNDTSLIIYIHIFSIVLSFMALLLCMSQMRISINKKMHNMTKLILNNERKQFLLEKSTIDLINIKYHDLKYILNNSRDTLNPKEVENISKIIDNYDSIIKTENSVLNLVLTNKIFICHSKGIKLKCNIDKVKLDFIYESDLYSLFSNIIDNAIEAVEKIIEPPKKIIDLKIESKNNFIYITEENFCYENIKFHNGIPQTSKKDINSHGFGIRSIKHIVKSYMGDLIIELKDKIYKMQIVIPIQKAE